MAGSGIYWTVSLEAFDGTYVEGPAIESADFTYSIMDASGTLVDFGNPDILPVNEPVGSPHVKGEYSEAEITAANLATRPLIRIYIKDNVGGVFRQAIVTDNGDNWVSTSDEIFETIMENGETFAEQVRLMRAEAAGTIVRDHTLHEIKSADGSKTRITATANSAGREVTETDGT